MVYDLKSKIASLTLAKTEGCWHCHYEEGERKELNISIRVYEPNEAILQLRDNESISI